MSDERKEMETKPKDNGRNGFSLKWYTPPWFGGFGEDEDGLGGCGERVGDIPLLCCCLHDTTRYHARLFLYAS
jgi:hypothetical protein